MYVLINYIFTHIFSDSSSSDVVYFTTAIRLVGLTNQSDLDDRCSHDFMELSSRLVNAVST